MIYTAYADCKVCHGTGIVIDWVPYGSTNVPMETVCDYCYERVIIENDLTYDTEFDLIPAEERTQEYERYY